MKNPTTFFLIVFVLIDLAVTFSFSQPLMDEKLWSVFRPSQTGFVQSELKNDWVPAEQTNRYYKIGSGMVVSPNFRPHPTLNSTQSEMSIDVHPSNSNIIFCSANASDWPVTMLYGTGVYWSLDGSSSWTGYDIPPFGNNWGDPVSIIGPNGYFYENFITLTYGQAVAISTNNGANWTTYNIAPNPGELADKNHFMVDKTSSSPYLNRAYCSWTDFGGVNNYDIVLKYSTNFGQTWTPSAINLSNGLSSYFNQGVNIQTGTNGDVYAVWAVYLDVDVDTGEDGIGFSKSTNGGVTWSIPTYAYQQADFGIRGQLADKDSIRVVSFPSMAVDKSSGTNNGNIYICWPQSGVAPAGTDPDIVLVKSTDGGVTWSSPIRVNDDPLNNGKDQYFPWCTIDQSSGQLLLVFYDSRDVPNDQAEVFMARSLDGGITFDNFKVSDQPHTPTPIQGAPSGYAGDYIGIATLADTAYPFWMDNRTGYYQGWMTKVALDTIVPVELTTFIALVKTDFVELSWTTATEINNQGFEVQRSKINSEFITIGFVEGHGTTTEEHHYSFKDKDVSGSLRYRLKQVDYDGSFEYSDIVEVEVLGNVSYELAQNYPNPFNPSTNISYTLPSESQVKLSIYNLLGELVETIVNKKQDAGRYEANWNAGSHPSGVYIYILDAVSLNGNKQMNMSKKMILLK